MNHTTPLNGADTMSTSDEVLQEPIEVEATSTDDGEVGEIEDEIEALRSELGNLVGELDRRRHEMTNMQLQASRHSTALIVGGIAAALLVAGLVAYGRRARQPDPLPLRLRKLGQAARVVSHDPDRLLRAIERKPDTKMAIMAALTKIAGTAGTRAVKHAL
ncbi:MAG TPA: hypothetical protein VEB21_09830 [Terriglobales bacterium]|nr:hypothetical protein [Terriglobales bacterium]